MSDVNVNEEADAPKLEQVFVYGTLKHGHGNNRLLADSPMLGRCYVSGVWEFVDLGAYPAVIQRAHGPARNIVGEVYACNPDIVQALDWLEGHPQYYERIQVATPFKQHHDNGMAWIYTFPERTTQRPGWTFIDRCWRPSPAEHDWLKSVPSVGGALRAV